MPRQRQSKEFDNDSYEQQSPRRPALKTPSQPLTLHALQQRLQSMKDYPSWQKTKLQRLNLSVCHTHADPPPVVEAILNYGNEEILSQMIKDTTMQSMVSQSRNIFKQLLTTGKRYHSQQTDKHPTFLNYKHDAQQKDKIFRMIHHNPIQAHKLRTKTEQKVVELKRHCSQQMPKQLIELKKQLLGLPALQQPQHSPREETTMNDSLIIEYESSLQPSLTLEIESAQKRERGISQEGSLRKSRKKYLEEIGFILRKSDNVLGLQSNPEQNSLASSSAAKVNHYNRSTEQSKCSLIAQTRIRQFWPSYHSFELSESDNKKHQKISEQFNKFINSVGSYPQQTRELIHLIQKTQKIQQQSMQKQSIQQQRQSFSQRYDQKMQLQTANYKKGIKQFVKCKQDYRNQMRRQQIRANGIKRFKRQASISKKAPVHTIQPQTTG